MPGVVLVALSCRASWIRSSVIGALSLSLSGGGRYEDSLMSSRTCMMAASLSASSGWIPSVSRFSWCFRAISAIW